MEMRLKHRLAFNEPVEVDEDRQEPCWTYNITYTDSTGQTGELREQAGQVDTLATLTGHAIVANQKADGLFFTEEVDKGAITGALEKKGLAVKALWNHNSGKPLAQYPDTLQLEQDSKGLLTRISPVDTQYARDLVSMVRAGVVDKMSFGFYILDEERQEPEDQEVPHFVIKEIELLEVSPVTFPFYSGTDLGVEKSIEQQEKFFRQRLAAHGAVIDTYRQDCIRVQRAHMRKRLALKKQRMGFTR